MMLWIGPDLGLDMVVRDESGDILDTNSTSTTQLYEHHIYAIERIRKATVSCERFDEKHPLHEAVILITIFLLSLLEFVKQESHIENDE